MSQINQFVQKLKSLSSNTAKSIIESAAVLVEAKQELSKDDYSAFLSQTKYDKDSSAVRKLEAIGNAQFRLNTISELLPANWTTIYKIASLQLDDFNILVEEEHLHPLMKASEIDAAINFVKPKPQKMRISLELDVQTDSVTAIKLIDDLKALLPKYLFQIKLNENLNKLINK